VSTSTIEDEQQTSSTTPISSGTTRAETSPFTNATAGIETSIADAQPFEDDNTALIGGIVGGVVALILVGGLVAFIVARSRRRVNASQDSAMQSGRQNLPDAGAGAGAGFASHHSNYESLALSPPENENHYAAVGLALDNYAKPSTNRNEYEFGDISKAQ
jgi:hypothetical protein